MAAILRVKDENGNIVSIPAIKGDKGEKGDKGDRGLPGSGGVPDGGTTGQILTKNSDEDGDAGWSTPEPFVIKFISWEDDNCFTTDKSFAQLKEAFDSGKNIMLYNDSGVLMSLHSLGNNVAYFVKNEPFKAEDGETAVINCDVYIITPEYNVYDPSSVAVPTIDGFSASLTEFAQGIRKISVLTTEQTLTTEQQTQALTNIGGLSKNQGTSNSGKFLGIGADGIVVPTEVSGAESEWKKIRDLSVTSEDGVKSVAITEDSEGNLLSLDEIFILIKSETKQWAYAPITIRNGNSYVNVGEYRLTNEAENAPGVIRIRPFGPYWMATYMKGGYQQNVVDYNWGFYYQKSQPLLSTIPKITGIGLGFSTLEAEVWGR